MKYIEGLGLVVVASFAEAWIENFEQLYYNFDLFVASFAEAWIENEVDKLPHYVASGRLLRGGVD